MKRKRLAALFAVSLIVNLILAVGFTKDVKVVEADEPFKAGDIVEFGSYPQTQVKDSTLIETLQGKVEGKTFKAYPYTSQNPNFNQVSGTTPMIRNTSMMSYYDFSYQGVKYRAVKINEYRPDYCYGPVDSNQRQSWNGFSKGNTYFFIWEPIEWIVLDPSEGLLLAKNGLDAPGFCEWYIYVAGLGENGSYPLKNHNAYCSDYFYSTLRDWLTVPSDVQSPYNTFNFLNTALNSSEQNAIITTKMKSEYLTTEMAAWDKLFILSADEFNKYKSISGVTSCKETPYCMAQGGSNRWFLRSKASKDTLISYVLGGSVKNSYGEYCRPETTWNCVRPAVRVDLTSSAVTVWKDFEITSDTSRQFPIIRWSEDDLNGVTKYLVYYCPGDKDPEDESNWTGRILMSAPEHSFYDDLVSTEKSYYYKVIADTETSVKYRSNYVECVARLATPVVTTSNDTSSGKPVLTWKDTGAKEYAVYEVKGGVTTGPLATISETKYEVVGAKSCTTSTYVVLSISGKGSQYNSVFSLEKTVPCKLPAVEITGFERVDNIPTITWKSVSGANYYKVECYTRTSSFSIGTTSNTSIGHPDAPTDDMVCYAVTAYTNAGTQYTSAHISYNHFWGPSATSIISAKAQYASIAKTAQQEFEVVTTTDVKNLMLYAEGGTTLVKSWAASGNSTVSGDRRIWKVSQAINTAGDRKLVFKGGTTNTTPVTNAVTVSFKVLNTGVISASAKNATIKKGGEQVFTVKTTSDAKYLVEYAENGNKVTSWTASSSNSTVNGNVRTWTVKQNIGTAGKRNLTFKAGTSTTPTSAQRTAAFTVEDVWVNSASAKYATIGKGGNQTFTVKTTSNAQNLMLYGEGGNLVKTWAASGNSTVSGDVRTWTVTLAIGTAGNRELTIKAGKTTTPSSFGKTVKFAVVEKKLVSASAKYAAITKASMQGFTVTTSADVQYLMLYAEDGKTLVKSWAASGNSTVDANKIRTWYVIQEIATAGNRKLVFKGGTTNTTAVTNALTVSFKVENTGVITASAKNATISKGATQTFTVTTTADCKYLAEYAENGNLVTSWTANSSNSKVSGNVRTWTVTQTINTAGKRTLTFKAGISSPTSAERNVSFTVQ